MLIVRLPAGSAVPSPSLVQALGALGCSRADDGAFEARIGPDMDTALRALALACSPERATAILHAPHPPLDGEHQPYRRLWDRTDEHGAALSAWRDGTGGLPPLLPGELIRL